MLDLGVRPMCFLQNFSGRLLMLNAIFKTPICNCENDIKVTFHYSLFTNTTTAQKMKFSIKDFSSKCVQIRSFLRIWSHLLEKSLMENFIFCAVNLVHYLNFSNERLIFMSNIWNIDGTILERTNFIISETTF